ncbi:4a-hydroxytetrahydrobiopterin dehydratase [Nonomuraea muscovyensis]|jgi:4a-hydroxytetrahydrobiopterin dehydratase|uniref:Putative pterin-4-alpha-carbinolamine dehydratase n=1 Tax=Nonomuraea muscovyensis TaxID=1124761 RepID=A0A7X0F346_9ACTN|nr:4a-hydroxytetrahydrobiopterin dehydratase [Nonomuraea muscovyensis]MBB6351336.1 4a-hydroxytetrahydrobiopterin dehydratase [Nonomuraea muscovyensis]MDF2709542.1 putative pterin-4-alpha-carbinolamine dehydratase [Nonomuraea muscovyensis]
MDPKDIDNKLAEVPEWRREGEEIRRTVTAPDFPTAIRIVDEIAVRAEELNHHPDIDIRWRTLHLALTTHDKGHLTDMDFTLAAAIDRIVAEHAS